MHQTEYRNIRTFFQLTHTDRFNGHFPGKPGLAGCPLNFRSPVILILSILKRQAKTLHTHMVLWAVPCTLTLTTIPRGFEAEVITGWMPFLSPNKQRQSTEGKVSPPVYKRHKPLQSFHLVQCRRREYDCQQG